jgi:GTP cyclohydrolase I
MIDLQNMADHRDIPLAKVGIKGLEYPIRFPDKTQGSQQSIARVDLSASLSPELKGTHMSRFIEVLHRYREDLSMDRFLEMLGFLRADLDAESAFGSMTFPYFMEKQAPVSGLPGMMSYTCRYEGRVSAAGKRLAVSVSVPLTTVCPCSKAISDRGAHNQRGLLKVELELGPVFWIEDMIRLVEGAASSPVYALLKREDEKFITEQGYDTPKFVEDLVRDVYIEIRAFRDFPRFTVEAESFESIHNHSAFAYAEYDRRQE